MPPASTCVRFGSFELDLHSGELRKNGLRVHLGEQPLQVLTLLLENPGQLVTREELRQRLWASDTFVDFDPSLNAAVKRLREALGDSADNVRFIETMPRRGYRFIYPLESATNHPPLISEPTVAAPEPMFRAKTRWWIAGILLAVGVALIPLARRTYHQIRGVQPEPIRAIVVLPLENLSHNPSEDYFSDGMTDALITELTGIRGLRVISRQSAMHYKGTTLTVSQIADELKVDGVVEGSAFREGDKVRISVQLIRCRPEEHLWAHSYERGMRNVLALQSEVAHAIAIEIKAQVTLEERNRLTRTRTVNPPAYDAYLKGNYQLNRQWSSPGKGAVVHFERAVALDPEYSQAYVGLAYSYVALPFFTSTPPAEAYAKAKVAAEKALELDPYSAGAYTVLARERAQYFDWSGAETAYRHAVDLNPGSAEIHTRYGWFLAWIGRFDEALAEQQKALEGDPFNLFPLRAIGMIFYFQHQPDRAIEQMGQTIQLDPDNVVLNGDLGRAYLQKGMYKEAIEQLEKSRALGGGETGGSATGGGYLGLAYAVAGRRDDALNILHGLVERRKKSYASPSNIAMIYLGLGNNDEALKWLEKGIEEGDGDIVVLKTSPVWDPLRSDSRFQKLLARMNFP